MTKPEPEPNPYDSPKTGRDPLVQSSGGVGGRVVTCLVAVAVIGILIALLLPAVRYAGPAAARSQCSNNLKQIGLALHNYHATYRAFPPVRTTDENGQPMHSWRTLILPFMEQLALYKTIDLSKPWDDPANQKGRETAIFAYQCPSVDGPRNYTPYLALVARNSCFQAGETRTLSEIPDHRALTLMVVEAPPGYSVPWMAPLDTDERWAWNLGSIADGQHEGYVNVLCVDGSVISLNTDVDLATLRAMISIDGDDDAVAGETKSVAPSR